MGYFELKKSTKDTAQPYYFVLKAANHEIIASSEMYSTKQAALKGIASVQKMQQRTKSKILPFNFHPLVLSNYCELNALVRLNGAF